MEGNPVFLISRAQDGERALSRVMSAALSAPVQWCVGSPGVVTVDCEGDLRPHGKLDLVQVCVSLPGKCLSSTLRCVIFNSCQLCYNLWFVC